MCLFDLSQPLSAASTDYEAITVVLPRPLFGSRQSGLDALHGSVIRGATPFGRMLSDHLHSLSAHATGFSEPEAAAAAEATAALLGKRTGNERFWDWYDEIWRYSWKHFVDHRYGAWYRILTCDNRKYSDEKSPAGKTDYHTMGACYEVLNALPGRGMAPIVGREEEHANVSANGTDGAA
ncbi:MAG: AGE family epimerase/isomerase [Paraburkholderia tropica]